MTSLLQLLVVRDARSWSVMCALVFALTTWPLASMADVLLGTVVAIADGDTLTVLDAKFRQHKIRLAGIDAPEKGQPFGNSSRQALAQLVFRRQVAVEWQKKDRYQRLVGLVRVDGTDAGLELLRAGLAWHYVAYAKEQSRGDRLVYGRAETEARSSRRGLWRESAPIPPWEYRASRRRR